MKQTIREYIEQDATFFSTENVTYFYVFVDLEEDGEEILLASYNTAGELEFETENICRNYLDNYSPEYVERNRYTYGGNGPAYVDVLIYDISEDEIKSDEKE